ncbi:MAG: endonuclease [Clostridia bacterium]|nr:endonuclease [Clostridia bacterium]
MKQFAKRSISIVTVVMLLAIMCFTNVSAAGTGYTKASDVVYKTSGKYIYNWGARDEVCVFLSTKAQGFYTGNNTFDKLSQNKGGTSQSNAPSSALYSKLQAFMKGEHKYINAYKENNTLLKYTDCVQNNTSQISSFYSGKMFSNVWDSAKTWNKEHTWPNSKGLGGSDEDDVMMIRPTIVSENSSRGNTAYGTKSNGYFEPDDSVKGDCARIALYVYCRWGNTGKMWGKSGVMENLDVLLRWMQEDPVDTWEMGRNDSVQAITGTRNVFVDYPEFAWLLFGRNVPTNMTTPSGEAKDSSNSGNQGGNQDDKDDNTSSGNQGGNQDEEDNNSSSGNNDNDNNQNDNSQNDNNQNDNTNNDNTTSNDDNQGGIDKKPNNGGKPFDPNNIGNQQVQTDGGEFVLDTWVIIAIVAGAIVLVAGVVVTVVIIKKKKATPKVDR